jgi:sulfonate transport system permease protein
LPRSGWASDLALGLALPLVLAIGWELAVRAGLSNGRLVPPPSRIIATLVDLWQTGDLLKHILATLARVGAGFALGALAGTLLGAISGALPWFRRLTDPLFQGLRSVPSIAWVPLFILWFGIFEAPKVTLIAVGVFFPVYLGVMGAIQSVDRKLVEVGRMFRLSQGGDDAAHPVAGDPAVVGDRAALRPRARLHVRGRGGVHGRVRRARLSAGRRPATGQAGPDRRGDHRLCRAGQDGDGILVMLTAPLLAWQDTARAEM